MTKILLSRIEELLMEAIERDVQLVMPEPHEHDQFCDDEAHIKIAAYDEGWHDCFERLAYVISERKEWMSREVD